MIGGIYDRITGLNIASSESGNRPEATSQQAGHCLLALDISIIMFSTQALPQHNNSIVMIWLILYCRRMCIVSEDAGQCNVILHNSAAFQIDMCFLDVLQGERYCLHEVLNEDIFRQASLPLCAPWNEHSPHMGVLSLTNSILCTVQGESCIPGQNSLQH